jgi:histone H3/H4
MTTQTNETAETASSTEVLIIASKLKAYIRDTAGMNTSKDVIEALSNRVRQLVDQAIQTARQDGRKTVMERDFQS